ncbi:MAG: hypothetical protein AB8G99_22995 [Planctomycetaceae bacterium]
MSYTLKTISIAAVLLLSAITARGQDEVIEKVDLAFNLETYTTTPRSYAPILGKITLEPRVSNLLEGTLHLQFNDNDITVLQMQIPDLAVAGTPYESAILIPPLPSSGSKGLNVDARFVMEDREIVLSSSASITNDLSLLITQAFQRGLLVGMVVEGKDDPKAANQVFLSSVLKFGTYAQQPGIWVKKVSGEQQFIASQSGKFRTAHATLQPTVVPNEPVSLCSFNILTIADEGLGRLNKKQLLAIIQWVKSGGSLCVVPDGALSPIHTNFLTDVLAEYSEPPPMTLNKLRELNYDARVLKSPLGLGRVVILPPNRRLSGEEAKNPLTEDECRDFAGFLWKVRRDQLAKEQWEFTVPRPTEEELLYRTVVNESATATRNGINEVTEQLMPRNVRMVPLSLVGMLLAAYVFLVGPGDYLLLGLLKARRFTWIVFPLVTAAFAFAMVALSNHFMSTSETGGTIEVHDVIGRGEVVRKTTLDLDFFAAPQDVTEEIKAELVIPTDIRSSVYDYQGGGLEFDEFGNPLPKRFRQAVVFSGENSHLRGRVPNSYTRQRSVKQWQPELSRRFSLTPSQAPNLGFDWENPGDLWTFEGRLNLQKVVAAQKQSIGLRILKASKEYALIPMTQPYSAPRLQPGNYYETSTGDYLDLISELSAPQKSFFRYVAAISPAGGDNFEDLAMLDPSDESQLLLIASWMEDDTQIIYRRLYRKSELSKPTNAEAQ